MSFFHDASGKLKTATVLAEGVYEGTFVIPEYQKTKGRFGIANDADYKFPYTRFAFEFSDMIDESTGFPVQASLLVSLNPNAFKRTMMPILEHATNNGVDVPVLEISESATAEAMEAAKNMKEKKHDSNIKASDFEYTVLVQEWLTKFMDLLAAAKVVFPCKVVVNEYEGTQSNNVAGFKF